jgi:hypothetical protein
MFDELVTAICAARLCPKAMAASSACADFLAVFGWATSEWHQWLLELTALYAMRAFVDAYSEHCADASCPGCPDDGI